MSSKKKEIRRKFRDAVFERDGFKCRVCGVESELMDSHHIFDRNLLPSGGYCAENGISLCPECHEKAEVFHSTGTALPGFSPDELYVLIGSSFELAKKKSEEF
jgi:5-methylcytosine-specific restriction endonuclease McrA